MVTLYYIGPSGRLNYDGEPMRRGFELQLSPEDAQAWMNAHPGLFTLTIPYAPKRTLPQRKAPKAPPKPTAAAAPSAPSAPPTPAAEDAAPAATPPAPKED